MRSPSKRANSGWFVGKISVAERIGSQWVSDEASLLSVPDVGLSEERVRAVAALMRAWFRNRAERRLCRASPDDLSDLRCDVRFALSGLSHPRSATIVGLPIATLWASSPGR